MPKCFVGSLPVRAWSVRESEGARYQPAAESLSGGSGIALVLRLATESFKFEKRGEFFVRPNNESAAVTAVGVRCEKHATSQVNLR